MIKPHQTQYIGKIKEILHTGDFFDFKQAEISGKLRINNRSEAFVSLHSDIHLANYIQDNIVKRVRAKQKLMHKFHTTAVSLHYASRSTYIKARNKNKRVKLHNKH